MPTDTWYLTRDLDDFLARTGDFLRARPAEHTVLLTVAENLRLRALRPHEEGTAPEFGVLESRVETTGRPRVRAAFLRTPPHPLCLTALTEQQAGTLADRLATRLSARGRDAARELSGVNADHATAGTFATAWSRRTGADTAVHLRLRLYRLGELTPPRRLPPGGARTAGAADRELLARWYREFCEAVGEPAAEDPAEWADVRAGRGDVTLWQTPDGTPVAMAGRTVQVAGQMRVAAVYTPAELRGRGFAGAVTTAASRSALDSGAKEVLLFADLANPTSTGVYQRIGYRPVSDFTVHRFG